MRRFTLCLLGFLSFFGLCFATAGDGAEAREPVPVSSVRLQGKLADRVDLGCAHLLNTRERLLNAEGHTQGWGGDGVCRWSSAMTQVQVVRKKPVPELAATIKGLIAAQLPDGSWGEGEWGHWGNGRSAIALAEYWQVTKDPDAMAAMRRLIGFFKRTQPGQLLPDPSKAVFGLEGDIEMLVALWRATGDEDCLALARQTADHCIKLGRMHDKNQQMHVTALSGLRGLAELYLAAGEEKYLAEAEKVQAWVLEYMWVTGGMNEVANTLFETKDETCQVGDWFRGNLRLWQITGKPEYLRVAERVYFNHLQFNQDSSGGFCAYRSLMRGGAAEIPSRDFVAWFCCSMHGTRELVEGTRYIFTGNSDQVSVNLFTAVQAELGTGTEKIILKQSDNPASPLGIIIEVVSAPAKEFTLRVRIPEWAESSSLAVNGETVTEAPKDGYVHLRRQWKAGDYVAGDFKASLKIIPQGINDFSSKLPAAAETNAKDYVSYGAILYGPYVLMIDPALNPHQMYSWQELEMLLPGGSGSAPVLPSPKELVAGRGKLAIKGACFMALARGVAMPEKLERSIADPTRPTESPVIAEKSPEIESEEWKVVFLVPISEITDRRTVTVQRMVPYNIRNNIRMAKTEDHEKFLARVEKEYQYLLQEKWLKTVGYRIRVAQNAE